MSEEKNETEAREAAEGKKCICGRTGKKCLLCRVLKGVLIACAALVVILLALPLWFGPVAKGVANAVVPGMAGTDFHLEKISLNPYTGKFFLGGCRLANPPGFKEKDAFSLESLSVDVEVCSLLTSKIHVRDISIVKPFASYLSENGTNNFDYILAHFSGDKKEEKESAPSDKKVVIDRVYVNGTSVKLGMMPALPLPTIEIKGIGADKPEGASFTEVGEVVWQKIQSSIGSLGEGLKALTGGLTGAVSAVSGDMVKNAGATVENAAKGVTDAAGNVTKGATDAVGNATKGAADAVGNATKALGGLFGGKK